MHTPNRSIKHWYAAGIWALAATWSCNALAQTAFSVGMDFKGYVTMLDRLGYAFKNSSEPRFAPFQGYRTPVSGHMVMNFTETGMSGTATIVPFKFAGQTADARDIQFVPPDTLFGTPVPSDTLLLGNLLFDYGPTLGIPVSIVLDMGNLSTALMSASVGDVITGMMRGASENTVMYYDQNGEPVTLPMGPVVVATTTWNTSDVDTDGDGQPGPISYGVNPSGTVPLLVDTALDESNGDVGLGGSPMRTLPFPDFNPNFDFTEVTVTCMGVLGSCDTSGLEVPAMPLSPAPLAPLQEDAGAAVKGLGL